MNLRKVVVAMDSFKGSVSSLEAGNAVKEGILSVCPQCDVKVISMADGGEGTMEAVIGSFPERVTVNTHDPLMRPIQASYLMSAENRSAFIEMAAAAGLCLLKPAERNPKLTTSYGVGEMIRDAVERGCRKIYVGLGGSATNDVGTGMLAALGYKFHQPIIKGVIPYPAGGDLRGIYSVEDTDFEALRDVEFVGICDVDNPLQGYMGATEVFAPQKGASRYMVWYLDESVALFSRQLSVRDTRFSRQLLLPNFDRDSCEPGCGAAGGMGAALFCFLNAELKNGVKTLLEYMEFDKLIAGADLIITGEGSTDFQSVMGKVPTGILEYGKRGGVPVVALSGSVKDCPELDEAGFAGLFSIQRGPISLAEAKHPKKALAALKASSGQIAALLKSLP